MNNERLIEKIKKLLALSDSSNPNEAAIALARAQKLMQEHDINEDDIDDHAIGEIEIVTYRGTGSKDIIVKLTSIIKKAFGVSSIVNSPNNTTIKSVVFFGPKNILPAVEYVFVTLSRSIIAAKKVYNDNVIIDVMKYIAFNDDIYEAFKNAQRNLVIVQFDNIREIGVERFSKEHINLIKLKKLNRYLCDFDDDYKRIFNQVKKQKLNGFVLGYFSLIGEKIQSFALEQNAEEKVRAYIEDKYPNLKKIGTSKNIRISQSAYNDGRNSASSMNIVNAIHSNADPIRQLEFDD